MLRFQENNSISRANWDDTISKSSNTDPYPYSWYLDIMCPKWAALSCEAMDYIMPLPVSRKFTYSYIFTPIFLQKLGVYSLNELDEEMLQRFLSAVPSNFKYIDLAIYNRPDKFNGSIEPRKNYQLKLYDSYSKLRDSYSSDCRRNVKLSIHEDVIIRKGINPSESINLFINGPGRTIKGISKNDYMKLERLMNYCISSGKGEIIGGYKGKKLIYSLFYLNYSNRITLLFTSSSEESRLARTGYRIVNSLIEEYSGKNYILDFAGSSIESIESFNRSFGSEMVKYSRLLMNQLPFPIRLLK